MSYHTVELERRDGMALVTLNRPHALNALSAQMTRELKMVLCECDQDAAVGVIVITGAGRAFQAGADISELRTMSPIEVLRWNQDFIDNLATIERMRQPVIAAINGFAFGGGLELALACTIRIAAHSAKMALPEVALGIIPGAGGTQRLPRLIGLGRAAEMILTGQPVVADEAYRIGLVNRIVAADRLLPVVEEIGRAILKNGPIALALAKDALIVGGGLPLDAAIQYAQKNCVTCFSTNDMREGTSAFLEKRPARFTGS